MDREKEIYRVTLVGSLINILLTAFKFVAGIVGHSAAMIADAVHSLSDLLTDLVVMIFVHISAKPANEKYDYGHGKFETLATVLIAFALLVVAGGIIYHACVILLAWLHGADIPRPGMLALWGALVSILLKEFAFQYTLARGRALNSSVVQANAWHHRSDALSSIGALIGIGGAILLGDRWTVLDPLASLLVGLFIVRIGLKMLGRCIGDLMEASLPPETEQEILRIVSSFPEVSDPHNLRTRRIGDHYAIEPHVRMDGDLSLTRAHDCSQHIERAIKDHFGPKTHITVHVEPTKLLP